MPKNEYKIVDFPPLSRKYIGESPGQVANKIFNKLMKYYNFYDNLDGKKYLVFYIENLSTNKKYGYIGTPILLQTPINVKLNNKSFNISHRSIVVKYDKYMRDIFSSELLSPEKYNEQTTGIKS